MYGALRCRRVSRVTSDRTLSAATAVAALTEPARRGDRVVVGLTGPPATGKSTAAEVLAAGCRERGLRTVVVPMDGFHLAQAVLDERGWAPVKGAPHTFDAAGYVELLARIRRERDRTVWAPSFDRSLEEPIAGAIEVSPAAQVVLTEGNYLLLPDEPWCELPGLLDAIWYVETPDELRRDRLIARHRSYGRSLAEASERALGSDERNAEVVRSTRDRADAILLLP
ncbi:nucleoside/nucleotide kinase family protein [Flexivirga endophytica]|uniref:Nucleoside/nucleotide kinase family protein n=1 Tax=Flexivirga endophytica TaxID=1849103 RepID=A0A916T2A6_9MICO|nr:nucleoside/nucleotide kinase family protein [Flexivirga endophytica]GHB54356.1 nucleoside/nucleotide kinase family protein [Flexivirga endophytica]